MPHKNRILLLLLIIFILLISKKQRNILVTFSANVINKIYNRRENYCQFVHVIFDLSIIKSIPKQLHLFIHNHLHIIDSIRKAIIKWMTKLICQ